LPVIPPRAVDEVLLCYPSLTAMLHYRIAHVLYRQGAPLVARIITEIAHSRTGIDIHPGATIDESFFIDHGTGVVIGQTAIIGKRAPVSGRHPWRAALPRMKAGAC
jgi:serine O-acetyltransferase